jgi:PTH1 family peptidyl-tRNA hydrolase
MSIDLVFGLGNPGPRYARTRHNVGFMVVDELVGRAGSGSWSRFPLCDVGLVDLGSGVVVAKPLTYMNRSGAALEWLLSRFSLEPGQALVVVDDLDLPLGRMRLRKRGGPGTHNGMRDVCEVVGSGYPRLRVGVRGENVGNDLAAWVTAPFAAGELEAVAEAISRAADAVECVVAEGLNTAMNRFNRVEGDGVSRES